jgi:class 3 adenylate cyclase/lipopolysaccharide biosynthesis regulator YciM
MDSLKSIVETDAKDTAMVSTLNALSIEALNNKNIPEALIYAKQANELAGSLKYNKGEAYALKNIGLAEYYQGNYEKVFEFWTKSLKEFESIPDTLGIANMSSNLGVIYYDQGGYVKALSYYLKSLSYSEKLNDPFRITTALVNIGGVYTQMGDYEKALSSYQSMVPYFEKLSSTDIESTYLMGIGEIHSLKGDFKLAAKYFREALDIDKKSDKYAHILTMLGKEEYKLGNKEGALDYLQKAYDISKEKNSQLDMVQTLLAMGDIYRLNDPKQAIKAYEEGESIAIVIETNEELRDIYQGISLAYEAIGNYKKAYEYQNKYLEFKDEIFNLETDDKIRGLQFDFDLAKKEDQIGLLEKEAVISEMEGRRQKAALYSIIGFAIIILFLAIALFNRYKFVNKTKKIIEDEKNKSDNLLLNILPSETANELKQYGKVKAKKFNSVTVLFTDFKGFTYFSSNLSPEELVKSVDYYFSKFDEIINKYDLEKIKTIGDSYMCAGGLPFESEDHAVRMIMAAFEISKFVTDSKELKNSDEITNFDIRIGLNSGAVVAGVVGTKKFAYDIWGDTVNVASRMESLSEPGRINISEDTFELVKDIFNCSYRGEIDVKNRGRMKMYFVDGIKNQDLLPVF